MADDKLSSERFAPTPSVTNFEMHVSDFQTGDRITVTNADEDRKQIALVLEPDDEEAQERAEQMAYDRFYNVEAAGVRDDVGQYCMVLRKMEN